MPLPLMLTQEYIILYVEVTLVIVEIHIPTHHEHSHHIVLDLGNEALVLALRVDNGIMHCSVHLFLVVKVAGEGCLDVLNVNLLRPSHKHVNVKQSIPMQYIQHMRKRITGLLHSQRKLGQETRLRHSMWLRQDQIITIWEQIKCIIQEVHCSRIKGRLDTEQSDGEGILPFLRWIWNLIQLGQLRHNFLIKVVL